MSGAGGGLGNSVSTGGLETWVLLHPSGLQLILILHSAKVIQRCITTCTDKRKKNQMKFWIWLQTM